MDSDYDSDDYDEWAGEKVPDLFSNHTSDLGDLWIVNNNINWKSRRFN